MVKNIITGLLCVSTFALAGSTVKLKIPPKELDKYYPPNSEQLVFLYNMYGLSIAFTGIFVNIKEGDWDNAKKWAIELKEGYLKIGQMVPKWDKGLRKKEIEALVKAVEEKNTSKVQKYAQIIGKTCSGCHARYQLPAKIKYHYPSFDLVSLEDPVSGMEYNIHDYMKKMTNDYKLTKIYTTEGDFKKASKSAKNFAKRFMAISQSCSECHTNKIVEDVYFGKHTQENIRKLKKAVMAKDSKTVFKTLGKIGGICYKCHNVHEIPAMLKEKFEDNH